MILDVIITGLVWLILLKLFQKHLKKKEIWVIEDCDHDIHLLEINLNLEDYNVRYFKSVKGLWLRSVLSPPIGVVCDYFLQDDINGDQVLDFFKRNHIPIILTTGRDGDIKNVPEDMIIRKTAEKEYYRKIERWVDQIAI